MDRRPFIRNKPGFSEPPKAPVEAPKPGPGTKPRLLRKHQTALPIEAQVARIQPGRVLLIPERPDAERDALARTWKAAGGEVRRLGRFWEPPADLFEVNVCVYGNDIFCQVLAEILQLTLVSPPDDMLVKTPLDLLGRYVTSSHLNLAREMRFPCFVKPVHLKQFAASVFMSADNLLEKTRGLEPATPLLVSEVVEFQAEARVFMYDQKVLDCALYQGEADLEGAREFAERVARLEGLPFGYVVDLGLLEAGWAVVEFNPAWGAGLKGCDPDKVLPAIAAATRARSKGRPTEKG